MALMTRRNILMIKALLTFLKTYRDCTYALGEKHAIASANKRRSSGFRARHCEMKDGT